MLILKNLILVYKALHGLAPDYLSEMFLLYEPGGPLRASGSFLSAVPQSRTKTFGDAASPIILKAAGTAPTESERS